ncbi:MAG: hypothetical protein AAFQ67_00730 [Pseudomonadota bacterium]
MSKHYTWSDLRGVFYGTAAIFTLPAFLVGLAIGLAWGANS